MYETELVGLISRMPDLSSSVFFAEVLGKRGVIFSSILKVCLLPIDT